MPKGKTHDAITVLLTAPVFAAAYAVTSNLYASCILGSAFVFGGLMFGPDLDTVSRQYSRWWIFKGLWFPYRTFFKHRSRWSHGLIFGTLLRVFYFTGVIALGGFVAAFVLELISGVRLAGVLDFVETWRRLGEAFRLHIGESLALATFIGLWLGAASHTFTDMAGTFIKTGKVSGFL